MNKVFVITTLFLSQLFNCYSQNQNNLSYRLEGIEFTNGSDTLRGSITLPKNRKLHKAIIFVSGDGPFKRSMYDMCLPIWNAFSEKGFACISWDRPGVGESSGNWLSQTMFDRAKEALSALKYLKSRNDIDSSCIGVWGISQAGWVLPIMAAEEKTAISFMIIISGAIVEKDQARYMIKSKAIADSLNLQEVPEGLIYIDSLYKLYDKGAPFKAFSKLQSKAPPLIKKVYGTIDSSRYEFMKMNALKWWDSRNYLNKINCPVLAIFGDNDVNVDYKESMEVYKKSIKKSTVILFKDADHVILSNKTGSTMEMINSLKSQNFKDGYIESMSTWITSQCKK